MLTVAAVRSAHSSAEEPAWAHRLREIWFKDCSAPHNPSALT